MPARRTASNFRALIEGRVGASHEQLDHAARIALRPRAAAPPIRSSTPILLIGLYELSARQEVP